MSTGLWRDYAHMLNLAVSVLERTDPEPAWHLVLAELARGMHAQAVSLTQARYAERTGRVLAWKSRFTVAQDYLDALTVRQIHAGNPLVAHYTSAKDRTPLSASQIMGKRAWLRSRSHRLARSTLGAHMLGIPLPAPAGVARGFVLHHAQDDFTAEEIAYARRVQPLLIGIDGHYRALERWRTAATCEAPGAGAAVAPAERAAEVGLTPRQLAVLALLAKAMPATAIAHRLHISPRTAHKHIEGIYRKLGTCDRLSTVMRAQSLGLLPPPSPEARPPSAG
ncbi:LuxR C-terminal-related transcriptional regulator [Streptomyces sp. NPDC088554]|uniref:helix-turn-helix transcriptional regulator n=1 Tax=Streptomyces sp. NPDC088554 TaxID=3365865 RepID=UPI003818B76B